MRSLWKPRLRIWSLLALIAGMALLLAYFRPTTPVIDAADARRIATDRLFADLAKDRPEPPKILDVNVMAPESGKYWQGAGAKPAEADKHWCVEIGFTVGKKTTGKGYYTITTDGTVVTTGLSTDTPP
jgi:hypothetical protein